MIPQAASWGHRDLVQLLLDAGAEPNKGANDGVTPLHMAAYFGHKDIVKILLDYGAVIDQLYLVFHQIADWGLVVLQGDTLGCSIWPGQARPIRNCCFEVNKRFATT